MPADWRPSLTFLCFTTSQSTEEIIGSNWSACRTGWRCRLDGREIQMDAVLARRDVLSVLIGGKAYEIKRERTATDMHLWVGERPLRCGIARSKIAAKPQRCSRG